MKMKSFVPMLLGAMLSFPVQAADVLNAKIMTLDLARDIANHTLEACRKKGFHLAVVVVDRAGGSLIGAPGGERDEACAIAGIKAVQERLDFAE